MNGSIVSTMGVVIFNGLQVEGTGTGLDATVSVGGAWVRRTPTPVVDMDLGDGPYFIFNDEPQTVEFAANASGSVRIDLVVARICDSQYAPSSSEFTIAVVEGTPGAGTPSVPADSCTYYELASVSIASGETIIAGSPSFYGVTDDDITDLRFTYQLWTNVCPYIELTASAGTSIAANLADTKVTLANRFPASTAFFNVATSVVTVNYAGLYDISGYVAHGAIAAGEAAEVSIWKNGLAGTRLVRNSAGVAPTAADSATTAFTPSVRRVALIAGDTIQLVAAQSSAGAVTTSHGANNISRLLIEKVG
jgi:hypothetical protein